MVNQVPGFGINTSCIRGIKSTYKTKLGSKGCQMQGMDEFQAEEKEEGANLGGGQPDSDSCCRAGASNSND